MHIDIYIHVCIFVIAELFESCREHVSLKNKDIIIKSKEINNNSLILSHIPSYSDFYIGFLNKDSIKVCMLYLLCHFSII